MSRMRARPAGCGWKRKRGLILLTCGVYGNVIRFLATDHHSGCAFRGSDGHLWKTSVAAARQG